MFYLIILGFIWAYMTVWFLIAIVKNRNDVADIAWGVGFACTVWVAYFLAHASSYVAVISNVLVTIWGVRLALHIYRRNRGKPEDYRYQEWRTQWGKWFYLRSYFQVFMLQGALLALVSFSVVFINQRASLTSLNIDLSSLYETFGILGICGIIVWIAGFIFESVSDTQLARFIKNPLNKGHIMQSGLWKYSRHPNYFGEVAQWWGLWIVACSLPLGWITVISPLTITLLIVKISGIPLLEKKMAKNPEFEDYAKRTPKFIPFL